MILHRYLLREVLQATAAVLGVLLLIYLSNRFANILSDAAAGQISANLLFQLLFLKLIQNLEVLIPVALFFGILIGLGRLYNDSEIVAMLANGVGIRRIIYGVLWVSALVGVLTFVLSVYAAPEMASAHAKLLARARGEAEISGILPGRFRELSGGDRILYVEELSPDRRTMRNVFVQVREKGAQNIVVSERAYLSVNEGSGDRFIMLEDGYRYTGEPGTADYVIMRFEKHAVRIDEARREPIHLKLDSLSSFELLTAGGAAKLAELQWRLSLPLSVVVLGMLAIPLSRTSPRQGKYAKLFTAVVVFFIYNNSIGVAQSLVERGELTPYIGIWPVHVAAASIALILIWIQNFPRWRSVLGLKKAASQ
jgi:lipopolysaccharide export system permease protein